MPLLISPKPNAAAIDAAAEASAAEACKALIDQLTEAGIPPSAHAVWATITRDADGGFLLNSATGAWRRDVMVAVRPNWKKRATLPKEINGHRVIEHAWGEPFQGPH